MLIQQSHSKIRKRWLRFLSISLGFWLGNLQGSPAQILLKPTDPNYEAKVKLVDEFIERFNGNEITPYVDKNQSDYLHQNLISLFNLGMFKSKSDPFLSEADSLIDKIIADSIRINYTDSLWFAKAKCFSLINGKESEITIWLNVERRTDDMSKWVIAKAEGDLLKLNPPKTSREMMLLPNDHETNFISLHRMTYDTPRHSLRFASKDYKLDETSVFFTLVNIGILKIEYVTDLQFYFYQVPGYEFTISYYERDKLNCGWLISSFRKISNQEKFSIMSYLH